MNSNDRDDSESNAINDNNNNINHNKNANDNVIDWTVDDVLDWAKRECLPESIFVCIESECIDGKCLLTLNERDVRDFRDHYLYIHSLSDMKHFLISIRNVQQLNYSSQLQLLGIISFPNHNHNHNHNHNNNNSGSVSELCYGCCANCNNNNNSIHNHHQSNHNTTFSNTNQQQHHPLIHHHNNNVHNQNSLNYHNINQHHQHPISSCLSNNHNQHQHQQHLHHHHHDYLQNHDLERISPPLSVDGRATSIQPELFKTMISLGYAFLVTWITAFVMVVVHERVPDMKRYPPLPDIFLDNVPHIPWAFHMCEITGTLLFCLWICVLTVHKHRMVLLRRFFALSGTVFLLRCVTMLITSLSVPGTHLQCNPNDYKVDDTNLTTGEAILLRISRAYTIWSGLGMSIQGVRTCGDYMFSGHTVALTILNFFITEYTPRNLYFLHTITWLLNMFGIFFILAAHEHYSIDVFVAFYITSRLFLYYHTLANNQALMSHDSNRTRIWFPMFSYFESSVDGIIPNEYDTIEIVLTNICSWIISIKDCCMLTARRFWIAHQHQLQPLPVKKQLLRQSPDQQQPQQQLNKITQFPRSNQNNENQQNEHNGQNTDEHNLKLQEFNLLSKSLNNLLEYNSYFNDKKSLTKQQQQNNNNFNNLNKIKINKEKIHDDILIKNNIDELNNNNNKTSNDNGLKKDN